MIKKALKIGLISVGIFWLSFCCAVYFFPQWFFYHPSTDRAEINNAHANGFPATEVVYASKDGAKLYGWYIAPQGKNKIIVFLHGNSYNIEAFYHKLIPLVEAGYGAFIGEYRGFGGVKGHIDQNNLSADSLAALNYLQSRGFTNKDIVVYGMSLGSYTAIDVVYRRGQDEAFAGLVLEVPFDSLLNVVKQRIWPLFPFEFIIKDKYENLAKLSDIRVPVLVMAASKDKVVPLQRAEALFAAANQPKKMIIYQGAGHSELYNYRNWRDILTWLDNNEKTE